MRFAVLLGTTATLLAGAEGAPQSDSGKAAKAQHLEPWTPQSNQGPLGRWTAALRLRRLQGHAAQGYNVTNTTTVLSKPTYAFPPSVPGYSAPSLPEQGPDVTDCPGYVFVSTTTVEVTHYVTEGGYEDSTAIAPGYGDSTSQTVISEDTTTTLGYEQGTEAPYAEHTKPVYPPYPSLNVSTTTTKTLEHGYVSVAPYPGNTTTAFLSYHSSNVSSTTTKSSHGYESQASYAENTPPTYPSYHSSNSSASTTKSSHEYKSEAPYAENTTPTYPSYHSANVSKTTTEGHEYVGESKYAKPTTLVFPPYHSANISTTTKTGHEYEAAPSYSENTTPVFPSYHRANVSSTDVYGSETLTTETATTRSADEYLEYGPQPPVTTLIVPPAASSSIYKNSSSILSAGYSSEVVTPSESSVAIESSSTIPISESEVTASPYLTLPAYGLGYEIPYEAASDTEVSEPISEPTQAYPYAYGEPSEVVTLSESIVSFESSSSVVLSETQVTVSPSEAAYASESSSALPSSELYVEGEETSTRPVSATDYFSTYATEPLPTKTGDCVIDTSIVPVSTAILTSLPATIEYPTKTVSEGDVPTGKPETGSQHCGVHGKPVGNYFLARFVENSPGVPVTLEGCYQFCDSVMEATEGCESYRFYPERGLDVARCDLYGSNVAFALDSVDDYYPDIWFDLDCGSPRADRWAHLPGLERLESLGLE
ncbi:hypothetical protein ACHAQA_003949 [Verticillium albo-atrum]